MARMYHDADANLSLIQAKKVGIIYDTTQDYTKAANDAMQKQLRAAGVTITIDEGIEPGAKSYSDTVTKVAATNPDLVYVITYYPEGGLIAKAMYDAKAKPKCFADYGAYDPGFIEAAGEAAANVFGVPTYVVNGKHLFWGQDRLELVVRAISGWSPRRTDSRSILLPDLSTT